MKENISIIFAAIIGTFLIVILPLYSILDRQDSMSYNVVLTSTTNFVDNIRNNGFIDRASYLEYISALASTSNTYKVTIEAYRSILIHETDENGNVIPDSYVVQKELYNTQDILEVLDSENTVQGVDADDTNIKNNAYLLSEDDEIYVRVYNTNVTSGSIIYSLMVGPTNNKVVDISYGGIVNNVNWELYSKIQTDTEMMPEVVMSVPVNEENNTNIQKLSDVDTELYDACISGNIEEYITNKGLVDVTVEELCVDILNGNDENYAYIYDLSETENQTIRVAVELRRFDRIDIGTILEGNEDTYTKISELDETLFNNESGSKSSVETYIIKNYIRLNGMYASVDLKLRQKGDYYVFDIILTDVLMSSLDYISTRASISVLAGLGEDENGISSLAGETVEIELVDKEAVNTLMISVPHIWNKLLKTKSLTQSRILNNIVYAKEDLAFVISYTGIKGQTEEEIVDAIKRNLKIFSSDTIYSDIEIYTEEQLNETYGINIATESAGHVLIKFRYEGANTSKENHIKLPDGWIETTIPNIADIETGEMVTLSAVGTESVYYQVLLDTSPPIAPTIALEGTKGQNGWYTSDVTLRLLPSMKDTIIVNTTVKVGGSGVDKNTIALRGATSKEEQELASVELTAEGTTYARGKAYDYVGNFSTTATQTIKIDKTAPTKPTVKLKGTTGANGWYTSNVTINITPGSDNVSGVAKTTYRIEGANALDETEGLSYTLTKEGTSKIIITTYDMAGNKSERTVSVSIDKSTPLDATITVVEGEKHSQDNDWYYTDVTLKITVDVGESISGLGKASYKITGGSQVPLTDFTSNPQNVKITQNGTHQLTVYTYTQAGNVKVTTYTVNIDKSAPNSPTLQVVTGTEGENDWYTSNVELTITSNGDVGPSLEKIMTYTITNNGTTTIEKEIQNNSKLFFNEEGEYTLTVYSRDEALNKVETQKVIKIDKTAPTPAEFVIKGTEGVDGWYISDVELSHEGAQDSVSGISEVNLSRKSITRNTSGTKISLTTKDYAGHTVTKEVTIKMDKSRPTAPVISIAEQATGSAASMPTYNTDVSVTITPGVDTFLTGVSNQDRTTYEITSSSGTNVIASETEGTSFKITESGIITITASTYDKAGNVTVATKVIWINKSKPATPEIVSINGESVQGAYTKEVTSTSNKISLSVNNLSVGNDVKVVLINQSTYERIEVTETATENTPIEIALTSKGTYSIKVTQTNMFGTQSDESVGLYYYTYE